MRAIRPRLRPRQSQCGGAGRMRAHPRRYGSVERKRRGLKRVASRRFRRARGTGAVPGPATALCDDAHARPSHRGGHRRSQEQASTMTLKGCARAFSMRDTRARKRVRNNTARRAAQPRGRLPRRPGGPGDAENCIPLHSLTGRRIATTRQPVAIESVTSASRCGCSRNGGGASTPDAARSARTGTAVSESQSGPGSEVDLLHLLFNHLSSSDWR